MGFENDLKFYIATAVFAKPPEGIAIFDTLETMRLAVDHGVNVQPYINGLFYDPSYVRKVIDLQEETGLEMVGHLPNRVTEADRRACETLAEGIPGVEFFVHWPERVAPIRGHVVGWENSETGVFSVGSVVGVREDVHSRGGLFALDFVRGLYEFKDDKGEQAIILDFFSSQIDLLREGDLIHVQDKANWPGRAKGIERVLGEGIAGGLIKSIVEAGERGVGLVSEYESVDKTLRTRDVILEAREQLMPRVE